MRCRVGQYAAVWLALVAMSGCAVANPVYQQPTKNSGSGQIGEIEQLRANVVTYRKGAIHDDFAGGLSKSYDLTQIEIIEAGKYLGQKLNVVHPSGTHLEPMWTTVGVKCVVEMGSWLLGGPDILIPMDSIKMTCTQPK